MVVAKAPRKSKAARKPSKPRASVATREQFDALKVQLILAVVLMAVAWAGSFIYLHADVSALKIQAVECKNLTQQAAHVIENRKDGTELRRRVRDAEDNISALQRSGGD